jgi:hypothetical protein
MKGLAYLMIVLGTLSLVATVSVTDATQMVFGLGLGSVGLLVGLYVLYVEVQDKRRIDRFNKEHW